MPAGTTVALVGATGSGKTTLVQLIPRLYDVSAGAVLVDGADVREVDVASLRSAIAVVDDDPFLFSATVAENIAYARADATQEEIELAARRAQAHEFIERLPEGYETRVGERGLTLSGGQRQRVAIARALLADPRILILDDATSSVDASTEQEIKAALREVMGGRTTFVIAHRLSTISLADTIVVLEDGDGGGRRRPRRAARAVRAVPRDRREGPARPGLPQPQRARARGGGAMTSGDEAARAATRRDDLRRRLRGTSGRARKLRGLIVLLGALSRRASCSCSWPWWPARRRRWRRRHWPRRPSTRASSRATARRSTSSSSPSWPARSSCGAATYAQTYLVGWVGQRALADLRLQIFRHLQEMPVGFYERRPAGMLISRMTNDVEALDSLVTDTVVTLFQASLTLVGSVAILIYLDSSSRC